MVAVMHMRRRQALRQAGMNSGRGWFRFWGSESDDEDAVTNGPAAGSALPTYAVVSSRVAESRIDDPELPSYAESIAIPDHPPPDIDECLGVPSSTGNVEIHATAAEVPAAPTVREAPSPILECGDGARVAAAITAGDSAGVEEEEEDEADDVPLLP